MSRSGRRLLLLRHAKAVAPSFGMSQASDHARALSERGRADAIALGDMLRSRGLMPERALVSTALRARETFALLDAGGPQPELSDALYLAEPWTLLEALRDRGSDAKSLVLVGHNPGMHELALMLAAGARPQDEPEDGPGGVLATELEVRFPTCAVALFAVAGAWSELAPGGAVLLDLLRP